MSKCICYSFLVILSFTMWRSPVTSAWVPSLTTTTTTSSRRKGLMIASAAMQRRRDVAPQLSGTPSTRDSYRATFSTSSTLHQRSGDTSSDAESDDMDQQHSRRRFLVQIGMRAVATITASTTFLTTAAHVPTAHAATIAGATDETIQQNQSTSSKSDSDPDPVAAPPKWPEEAPSPLPSPWTNTMSPPSFESDTDSNGGAAVETTDFSRAMQKAAKQKQVDPRTHG
jgi:hypothetical protein